jgi:hypothetical protein
MENKREMLFFSFALALVLSLYFVSCENVGLVEIPNGTSANFTGGIGNTLSQNIVIPSGLEGFAKYLFNISSDKPMDLQTFIIYFCLWIMLLLIIKSAFEILPIFGEGWKSWLGAIVVTIIASSTGAIKTVAIWFFSLGKSLTKTSVLWIVFDFLVLVLLFIGLTIGLKKMKSSIGEERARAIGMKTSGI